MDDYGAAADFLTVIPAFYPRHPRESGNPETNNVIRESGDKCSLPEIKHESRATNLFSLPPPVIPAKAGIQTLATKPATRNQAPRTASGSLLPSPPVIPAKAGIQRLAARISTRNQAPRCGQGRPRSECRNLPL